MSWKPAGYTSASPYLIVRDAETTFAKAGAAGGQIVQDLKRSGDGDLRGGVADGNGAVWWISTQEVHRE